MTQPKNLLAQRRLMRQHVTEDRFTHPEDVVRWMGAMQAQDYHQAVWGIGVRTASATVVDVEQAIEEAKIIRTWPMRGTIHFIPPENVRWMLEIMASRIIAAGGRRWAQLELTLEIFETCKTLFERALEGGKRLSRPDAMQLLEDHGISTKGARGYHILTYLAQVGVLCMGPMAGKQQTFVLLDEWIPKTRDFTREEALAELATQYFRSHGPATVYDLAWWAGITLTDARVGLAAVQAAFVSETVDGAEYWMSPEAAQFMPQNTSPIVELLPGYDEFYLGYKDRDMLVEAEHAYKVVPGNNGVFYPMIVVDGQIVGTWKRIIKKKAVEVEFQPFTHLDDVSGLLGEKAQTYADFVQLPLAEKSL